jgi:glycyl-tRNA synthetase
MEMEVFYDHTEPKCAYLCRVKDIQLPLLVSNARMKGSSEIVCVPAGEVVSAGYVQSEWSAYFMAISLGFAEKLGIPSEKQRFEEKLPAERAHYSAQTFDHQIRLDRWGWVEIGGHAYRTDYDLSAHIKKSRVDLSIFKPYPTPIEKKEVVVIPQESVLGPLLREKTRRVVDALSNSDPEDLRKAFDKNGFCEIQGVRIHPSHVRFEERNVRESGRRVIPHVIEPSYGAERLVYASLEYAYTRIEDRVVLKLPFSIAPMQIMVFPLMPKDGLDGIAMDITEDLLSHHLDADYDESGTIGRRYARADEVGVPLSITVDYQTKKDMTVTLRERDSWCQVRTRQKDAPDLTQRYLTGNLAFYQLGTPVETKIE